MRSTVKIVKMHAPMDSTPETTLISSESPSLKPTDSHNTVP